MKIREDLDKLVNKALDLKESEETLESKVKDWYLQEYSTDTIGEDIDPEITFAQVLDNPKGVDQSSKLAGDSVVRERVFEKISELTGKSYDYIYQKWLRPELFENAENTDMIQCVIKIQDIGNAYKYIGIVEDNSDYVNQYDVDNEYSEGEQDPTIEYILCYHNDGEKVFYNEDGEELNLDMEEQEQFEKDYQDAINSEDNTVIPDKDMI